jgi:uncharacterized membrane protein YvlD (DUF360 family)
MVDLIIEYIIIGILSIFSVPIFLLILGAFYRMHIYL